MAVGLSFPRWWTGRAEPCGPLSTGRGERRKGMGLTFLEPLMVNGPWAAVLVVCAPLVAIVIMFVSALILVPRGSRVDAIHAMAELVKALRPSATGRRPP
jgi:hypothetical protein